MDADRLQYDQKRKTRFRVRVSNQLSPTATARDRGRRQPMASDDLELPPRKEFHLDDAA